MNTWSELSPLLAPYQVSLWALTLLSLAVLVQSFLTAPLAFLPQQQSPGMPLQGNHTRLSFRVLRTHLNSVENLAPFGFTVLLAVLLEANPSWVNALSITHLVFRLLFWAVYYSGVGKVAGGWRTLCFVGGLLANLILIGFVIVAAI